MATAARVSLALDRYDRHLPFMEGTVPVPDWLDLQLRWVGQETALRDGTHRHSRMLVDREFDVCETSLASYVVAKGQGLPFTAVPVFPRRLFSQTQMFVNAAAGIASPADLAGRRVGLQSFQTTLGVLARGDLKFAYGVDWRSLKWVVRDSEALNLDHASDLAMEPAPEGADLGVMLAEGEIDALFFSRTPDLSETLRSRVRRLFPDPVTEAQSYFAKYGWYPVMHVLALREDVAETAPDLPAALIDMFAEASRLARSYYVDPNWLQIAFARLAYEEQASRFAADVWPAGLARNRPYLERFIDYAVDQGLIGTRLPVEALFHPSTLET